jgi:hypothetical protein
MDPISAVSLASTVVQFLDFGLKIVSKASDIYHSVQGAEIRNIDLGTVTESLVSLNRRVQNRARRVRAYAVSEDEQALGVLTEECKQIGETLVAALQNARVQGAHRGWKSMRQALKSVLGRDGIEELYDRLKQYREQIVVVLLVITSSKQTGLEDKVLDVKSDMVDLESRVIDETRRSRFQILDAIQRSNLSPYKPQDVATASALLSEMMSRGAEKNNKDLILQSLYYPRMHDRREWISAAHAKTFNWALTGSSEASATWADLSTWLRKGNGIYWLGGKAGSGKSTLMKYIDYDERSGKYLEEWASSEPLVVASFYFWNPGTSMQKSQVGLLQSLLCEILKQRPSLIPKILPTRWQSVGIHGNAALPWSMSELSDAFSRLAHAELETKFCFFIDGLDEFDGNHQSLIELIIDMTRTSRVKILASSRPWLVFQDAFESSPKLMLQDLTHDDIEAFTHDTLYRHPRFSRLLSLESERAPKLVNEIVTKASGVFLWVFLVVKSLMEGLTNADRMADLERRLMELPADLEQYFLHILTSLDRFYLFQAAQLFRLALEARKPLSVLTFSYLDEEDPEFAIKRVIQPISDHEEALRCETIERRLNSRCKGRLECRRRQSCESYATADGVVAEQILFEVDFLHRTVRDFLATPTVHARLVAPDSSQFDANMTLSGAFVAQIKGLRMASHHESNFQALWELVFDALHHIRHVKDSVFAEAQVALLDELDRAAAHFRQMAIVKRRCKPSAHWVNTGYRYGLDPQWDSDFLTLCIQQDLRIYVREKLVSRLSLHRSGRPLLAFAMTRPAQLTFNQYSALEYDDPKVEMVRLLLEHGADPNEQSGSKTIWVHFLVAVYTLATIRESSFYKNGKVWFDVTKLLIMHGADPRATCQVQVPPGVLSDRVKRVEKVAKQEPYTTIEVLRMVFGGDSGHDLAELEDLLEQLPEPAHSPTLQSSFLKVSGQHGRGTSSVSLSSQISQESSTSWCRLVPSDSLGPGRPVAQDSVSSHLSDPEKGRDISDLTLAGGNNVPGPAYLQSAASIRRKEISPRQLDLATHQGPIHLQPEKQTKKSRLSKWFKK